MKPIFRLRLAALYATLSGSILSASTTAAPAIPPPVRTSTQTSTTAAATSTTPHSNGTHATAPEKSDPILAEQQALEEALRIHIRPARVHLKMETPPPPPRVETKPAAPTSEMVWVPGHWAPANSEWQWKPGVWGFPATPISVWIEARYDAKTKQWTAGYWQPDREQPYDQETPQEAPVATEKFF